MCSITDTISEVKEFAHTHYTLIFKENYISDFTYGKYIEKSISSNIPTYKISLDDSFPYSILITCELLDYPIEKIYASLCLFCLFGQTTVEEVVKDSQLPQIEWYVKDKATDITVEASNNYIYIGSEYFLYSGDIIGNIIKGNKILKTYQDIYTTILYGYDIKNSSCIYKLPLLEIEIHLNNLGTLNQFCKIIYKSKKSNYLDGYGFIITKDYKLKYFMIGVNESNG